MISGEVSSDGVPTIVLELVGRRWEATIDTGFNGYLELPLELKNLLPSRYIGEIRSVLAGGQAIDEDAYRLQFPFDGETMRAVATYVDTGQILVGTRLLHNHRLEIDFVARTVILQRV